MWQDDSVLDKFVCEHCIDDPFLKTSIKESGKVKSCTYCGRQAKGIGIEFLASEVNEKFKKYFEPGEWIPSPRTVDDSEDDDAPYYTQEGEAATFRIREIVDADETIADDILEILKRKARDEQGDSFYEQMGYTLKEFHSVDSKALWETFCYWVKHRERFFSEESKIMLDELFADFTEFSTNDGSKLIRRITEKDGLKIFRARESRRPIDRLRIILSPQEEMKYPPSLIATAGRLNPSGISVFYAALDRDACVAELRPPVGSAVISSEYRITRPMMILDLTALSKMHRLISYFDPEYEKKRDHLEFLRSFESEISKPILPDEVEIEYIPTQVFASYLQYAFSSPIQGIIYSSTQAGRDHKNIVVFKLKDSGPIRESLHAEALPLTSEYWSLDLATKEPNSRLSITFKDRADYVKFNDRTREPPVIDENTGLCMVSDSLRVRRITAGRGKDKDCQIELRPPYPFLDFGRRFKTN